MCNPGITAQYGFEFQKLAFLFYALQLAPGSNIIYEGQDDVQVSKNEKIMRLCLGNLLIQVKSGGVTQEILEKIFCNWLLKIDKDNQFVCVLEQPLKIDYADYTFIESLITKIVNVKGRSDSLLVKVQKKYNATEDISNFKTDLLRLIKEAQFMCHSVDNLLEETKKRFQDAYCEATTLSFICDERFNKIYGAIRNEIGDALLKKEPYVLSYSHLFQMNSTIREKTNEDCYEESFEQFKTRSIDKVEKIMASESDSVKQLKLVFNNDTRAVLKGLSEQVFYEDLRRFFVQANKTADIRDLEYSAHSNYEDVLSDFIAMAEERTPYKTYKRTTEHLLRSNLLPQGSSNFQFYNRGCYIYLTDSEVEQELKIKWGDEDGI